MNWKDQAALLLCEFAKKNSEFTCTQAFRWAYSQGLPVAESPKQLGPVFRETLIKTDMVRIAGYSTSDDPAAKGRKVTNYRSVICQYFDGGDGVELKLTALLSSFRRREIDAQTLQRKSFELGQAGKGDK